MSAVRDALLWAYALLRSRGYDDALSLLVAAALIELRGEAAYGFARAALDAVSRERTFFGDEAEALNALDRALRERGA